MDIALVALGTLVGPLPGVQALVQLQVHKLSKLGRAHLTLVRFFSRMQSKVGLEIAGAAESLVADLKHGEERVQRKERKNCKIKYCQWELRSLVMALMVE